MAVYKYDSSDDDNEGRKRKREEEPLALQPVKRRRTDKPRTFNLLFRNPSKWLILGPSQAGKTSFVLNLLRYIHVLFEDPRCAQNVVYYYNHDQPALKQFRKENIVTEWRNTLPTSEEIKQLAKPYVKNGGSIVVIDDFGLDLKKDTAKIYTQTAHHYNVCVILLQQNMYSQVEGFRDISLNNTYSVLYKNPRDKSQIGTLAKQISPGNGRYVTDIFRQATRRPHSYLLVDSHQKTKDCLRLRTNVLPYEGYPIIWMSTEQMAELLDEENTDTDESDQDDGKSTNVIG